MRFASWASLEPRQRWLLVLEGGALLLVFGLLAIYVSRTIWDIDLFWHIAAGRAFVEAGEIVTTDTFSAVEPDRTWITFQWGYQVLVHGLDSLGGLQLVRYLHAAVMLASFALFWWGCRRRLELGALPSLFLLVLLIVLFEDRIRVRPHVFNLLAWSILFPFLSRGPSRLDRAALITTPLVVAVWANLHAGGALLFLVAAAALPGGALLERWLKVPGTDPRALRRAFLWYGLAVLPALVSPHFVRGNLHALTMLETTQHAIAEWHPAWHFLEIATTAGHLVCGLAPTLFAACWAVLLWRVVRGLGGRLSGLREELRRVPVAALALGLALTVLAHRSVRFVFIAGIGLAILWPWLKEVFGAPSRRAATALVVSAVAAVVGLVIVAYRFNVTTLQGDLATAVARAFGSEPLEQRRFPTAHADFLQRTGFSGGIFAQPNWGGYLLYRLYPAARVTADGRGNYSSELGDDLATVYRFAGLRYAPSDLRDPAKRGMIGQIGARLASIYERESYRVDAIVHQHHVWPLGFVPDPRKWRCVFDDPRGAVWIRADTETGRAYLESLSGSERCRLVAGPAPPPGVP